MAIKITHDYKLINFEQVVFIAVSDRIGLRNWKFRRDGMVKGRSNLNENGENLTIINAVGLFAMLHCQHTRHNSGVVLFDEHLQGQN